MLPSSLRAVDVVKSELAGLGMVLVAEGDVPVLIREHSRKFQLMLAHKLLLRKA